MNTFASQIASDLRTKRYPTQCLLAAFAGYCDIGTPYVFGGEDPSDAGMDCSGAIQWHWYCAGLWPDPRIDANRLTADAIYRHSLTPKREFPKLRSIGQVGYRPGDALFYGTTVRITHVAMCLAVGADGYPSEVLSASNGNATATDPLKSVSERRVTPAFSRPRAHEYRADFVTGLTHSV